MRYTVLSMRGELWVAYPSGMRFPAAFAQCYPFRGRGIVSKLLYFLNKTRCDGILPKREDFAPLSEDFSVASEVAFFWPSKKRTSGRFYGYKIGERRIVEYWKIGVSDVERRIIRREADNAEKARAFANGVFKVPGLIDIGDIGANTVARYEALPDDAMILPLTEKWIGKVDEARNAISAAGYRHGDFSWHNFKASGDDLWILDWEEMSASLPDRVDEISLNCGRWIYWDKAGLRRAFDMFDDKFLATDVDGTVVAVKNLVERGIAPGELLMKHLREKEMT